jgi:hypothetical protein
MDPTKEQHMHQILSRSPNKCDRKTCNNYASVQGESMGHTQVFEQHDHYIGRLISYTMPDTAKLQQLVHED